MTGGLSVDRFSSLRAGETLLAGGLPGDDPGEDGAGTELAPASRSDQHRSVCPQRGHRARRRLRPGHRPDHQYLLAAGRGRDGQITINGGSPINVTYSPTGGFDVVSTLVAKVTLNPGSLNTVLFSNTSGWSGHIDKIMVTAAAPA